MIVVLLAFVLSVIGALICIPFLAAIARQIGLVDVPDDKRKLHTSVIPMVGGLSTFIVVFLVSAATIYIGVEYQAFFQSYSSDLLGWLPIDFERRQLVIHPDDHWELPGLLIGSVILVVVGILDDRFGIRGRQKLMGQFLATTVLIVFGYHFDEVTLAGVTVKFDIFSVLFVYAWVLAAVNSVNLLDGADGIAGTSGVVRSVAMGVMAIYQGSMVTAIIAISLAGALVGFLRFNFPPAKVYLGDTGSMLIGFLLAALAIRCTFKQNSAYAFFAPVALLAIPFIDTGAAIIRRRLMGRSIFAVDRGHLHHSLMKRGYSPRISLLWVALLSATTAAGGVLALLNKQSEYALVSIAIVLIVMIACRIFGVAEFQLVSRKASDLSRALFKSNVKDKEDIRLSSVHVQGNRDWSVMWQQLCEFADSYDILELTLDLNAPWLHESFHATRRRSDMVRGGNHEWNAEVPLIAEHKLFGRVEIIGSGDDDFSHREVISSLLDLTVEIEKSFREPNADAPTESVGGSRHDSSDQENMGEEERPPLVEVDQN